MTSVVPFPDAVHDVRRKEDDPTCPQNVLRFLEEVIEKRTACKIKITVDI